MVTDKIQSVSDLKSWVNRKMGEWPSGCVVLLSGALGSGKTELVRCAVQALFAKKGITEERVVSPTFVIHQSYPAIGVEHFDLYRFEEAGREALVEVGYYDAIIRARSCGGFAFVEWPEKMKSLGDLEGDHHVTIAFGADGSRTLTDLSCR